MRGRGLVLMGLMGCGVADRAPADTAAIEDTSAEGRTVYPPGRPAGGPCDPTPPADCAVPAVGTARSPTPVAEIDGFGGPSGWPAWDGAEVVADEASKAAWVDRVPGFADLDPATQRGVVVWRGRSSTCGLSTVSADWTEAAGGSWRVDVMQEDESLACDSVCDAEGLTARAWIVETTAAITACVTVTGGCCDEPDTGGGETDAP